MRKTSSLTYINVGEIGFLYIYDSGDICLAVLVDSICGGNVIMINRQRELQ